MRRKTKPDAPYQLMIRSQSGTSPQFSTVPPLQESKTHSQNDEQDQTSSVQYFRCPPPASAEHNARALNVPALPPGVAGPSVRRNSARSGGGLVGTVITSDRLRGARRISTLMKLLTLLTVSPPLEAGTRQGRSALQLRNHSQRDASVRRARKPASAGGWPLPSTGSGSSLQPLK